MQRHDPTWHLWERLADAAEAQAKASLSRAKTQREALKLAREVWFWTKRTAVAVALWATSAGVVISKDHLADLIVALLTRR